MKTKTFDCIEMKRKGAKRIFNELRNLRFEEQLNYWKTTHEELAQRQKKAIG